MDADAALDAMAWPGERVCAQSLTDRDFLDRAFLQR